MELTYDPKYNIAYIRFHSKTTEVESIKVSEELVIDISSDGTIYGIELLNANRHLGEGAAKTLVVVNKETGQKVDLQLPI